MRVNDSQLNQHSALGATDAAPLDKVDRVSGGSGTTHVAGAGDTVTLSDLTALLAQFSAQTDPARSEYVERIAATYQAGLYTVDNRALGSALIDRAFEG